jgi:broad specificity phosphatase PhoE
MITTVFLVRHGQTTANVTGLYSGRSDEGLNEVGFAQAHRLSTRLSSLPINSVYSSPLPRAHTTAKILAEPHGLDVKVLDDLIEIDLGDWQGLYEDEVKQRWPDLWKQSRVDPSGIGFPKGESFSQVAERAVRAFETVLATSEGAQVVIVTHDIVVRMVAAHILGVPHSIYRRLDIGNASLSAVRSVDGTRQLVTLNDTSHLEGLRIPWRALG